MPFTSPESPPASLTKSAVPRVLVTVDKTLLHEARGSTMVQRVEVRHELGRPTSVVIETYDLEAEDLEWIDGGSVSEGRPLLVEMGLDEATKPVFAGEVTGLELELSPDEPALISIRGYDRLHRLARGRRTRAFVGQRDSQIVAAIAQEHGLIADGPDSPLVHDYALQREQTDLAFILARARRLGYVVRLEDKKLYFGPRGIDKSATGSAKLGVNLLSLRASTSTLGQVGAVTALGWDPAEQKAVAVEVAEAALASTMGGKQSGAKLADAAFKAAKSAALDLEIAAEDAAKVAAAAELEEVALRYVVCSGRMLGEPTLRPGQVLTVGGFVGRFAGDYWLTAVVHRYDRDGFTTEFEARRTAT